MTKIFWCNIVSRDFKLNTAVIDRGQALYFLSITKGIFPCNRCFIYPIKIKCAGLRWKNLAPWKLEYFSFFFYLSLDQQESVIESVADFYSLNNPFQNGKKIGGGAWVYPPRRVSQPFIFGEFSINWVLKKSQKKIEKRARKKIETDSTRKRL